MGDLDHAMMRGILTLTSLVSVVLFPWPLTTVLVLASASVEPLLPFSVGLLADTLYYVPHAAAFPLFTLCGAAATVLAFFVRSRLGAGPIR